MKKILITGLSLFLTVSAFAASNHIVYQDVFNDVENLKVKLSSEKLSIIENNDDKISVTVFSNRKQNCPNISFKKDTLSITHTKHNYIIGDYCDIEVAIPKDYKFADTDLQHTSGDLEIENLSAKTISIESTSGSLQANKLIADSHITLNKTSGSIKVNTIDTDSFIVESTSGSTKINDINTIETKINSTSGSIRTGKVKTEVFKLESSSGTSEINDFSTDTFDVYSTSGSIKLCFESIPSGSSKIHSTSGSVKLKFLTEEGFDLSFSTSSGSFHDNINDIDINAKKFTKEYFGGGTNMIVSTTSGSLSIE